MVVKYFHYLLKGSSCILITGGNYRFNVKAHWSSGSHDTFLHQAQFPSNHSNPLHSVQNDQSSPGNLGQKPGLKEVGIVLNTHKIISRKMERIDIQRKHLSKLKNNK